MEYKIAQASNFGPNIDLVNDYNGSLFQMEVGSEPRGIDDRTTVYFADGIVTRDLTNDGNPQLPAMNGDSSMNFLTLNYNALTLADAANTMSEKQVLANALLRLAYVRKGLISHAFTPGRVFVNSNETQQQAVNAGVGVYEHVGANPRLLAHDATFGTIMGKGISREESKLIINASGHLLSIVATVFHLRGHHYIESQDIEKRRNDTKYYTDLLITVFGQETATALIQLLTIKGIARFSCHAIPPVILLQTAYEAWPHLHGAIKLRLSSMPAGSAIIGVVEQGINDIIASFPAMAETQAETLSYISQYKVRIGLAGDFNPSKWKLLMRGSVNARLYGQVYMAPNEKKLAQAAAIVHSCYTNVLQDSNILDSMALRRASNGAQFSGYMIAQTMKSFAKDKEAQIHFSILAKAIAGPKGDVQVKH